MARQPLSIVVAIALAAAIGFAAGYAFHLLLGSEVSAARQAVFEAQSALRVLQAYDPIVHNHLEHKRLAAVRSIEDVKRMQAESKEATLTSIEYFEHQVRKLELPRERKLAEPFLLEASKMRAQLNAAP